MLAEFEDPDDARDRRARRRRLRRARRGARGACARPSRARVFAGVAGWGPEQLEDELERDDWIIEPASIDAIFTDDPDGLWSDVLRRKGGHYELVSRMPLDPSLN